MRHEGRVAAMASSWPSPFWVRVYAVRRRALKLKRGLIRRRRRLVGESSEREARLHGLRK